MSRLAVIPCSGAKLDRPAPAGQLYVGSWHQLARRAADALVARDVVDQVVILSALHGLVQLDQVVAPYDQRLTTRSPNRELSQLVAAQLGQLGASVVIGLLPAAYRTVLANGAGMAGVDRVAGRLWPLEGAAGVGYQRQRLAAIVRGELLPWGSL